MKFSDFLEKVRDLPVIESSSLAALGAEPRSMAVQLTRWVNAGRLLQLRRGLYLLSNRLRHREPPLEYLANLVKTPSYVSLEYALYFHGMIPETAYMIQSVTTGRRISISTPAGDFSYRHVKPEWFFGYREHEIGRESALVALPEKALLDLIYLSKGEFTRERIEGLRLQNLEELDTKRLLAMANKSGSPRVGRAAAELRGFITEETKTP
jgi:predicted transcriptional regulator of viral defense system